MKEILERNGTEIDCPVAIIIKDNKVLLGHRDYAADGKGHISAWILPGGRCGSGEKVETTLRREIEEETGITDLEICHYITEVRGAKEGDRVPIFLCNTPSNPELMEPEKFLEWKWFSKDDFPENFLNEEAKEIILKHIR